MSQTDVKQLVEWLHNCRCGYVFTGAGISTESGIPDFRSPGGVWSKNRTVYFDEFVASSDDRYEYWRQKSIAHQDFTNAEPNVTHATIAMLERKGRLHGVITQNIDGLHRQAGSRKVMELHGTAREIACLSCDFRQTADVWVEKFLAEDAVPNCPDCGGLLKHATVSFGQSLPEDVLQTAANWASDCDLFLALGSSLVVEPAASLPRIAKQAGAHLVIVNRDSTPLDEIADSVIHQPLGEVFTEVARSFRG